MAETIDAGTGKRGRGRPPGAPNKITRDIRAALRDLAEGNADRVQSWLDTVAEQDPAEALRLWLALLRYVTPTLQAAAIADLTPKSDRARLATMTDEELMEAIVSSQEAAALVNQGVKTEEELLLGLIGSAKPKALPGPTGVKPTPQIRVSMPGDDELLR